MKLAVISYILPGNFTGDGNGNYFSYKRENEDIPIEISQTVSILESILIAESREILFPESSIIMNLLLDDNYKTNLSVISDLGEIVAVKGVYVDNTNVKYEYPITSYWITSDNMLMFNSPMKYLFTNVSVEYVPQLSLAYNPSDGYWYLPSSYSVDGISFTESYFVSDLYVNNSLYGTFIHPDVDVGYIVGTNSQGTYVQFSGSINPSSTVKGTIHFGKKDNEYLYTFSLSDELLYRYNILESGYTYLGGELYLNLNIGFKDIIYSELSQVTCDNFKLKINLFQSYEDILLSLGSIEVDLDNNLLGYHLYTLTIPLDDIDQDLLIETITRGADKDLYITLETSVSNCFVDGNLFKGLFGQEILSASLKIDTTQALLSYNNEDVETPYVPITQENIALSYTSLGYTFEQDSLLYDFDFDVSTVYTPSFSLTENIDYIYDSINKKITLIKTYSEYYGALNCDVLYKAFEWKNGTVSTLEPISFTFSQDYTQNITKFLEFQLQFSEVPGYQIEKIDETSSRLVLSKEEKSVSLLNFYLYNMITNKWDLVNFVTYDDYTGTNTFSYIVDRNSITFEDYFNKTNENNFAVVLILTVDESVTDYYSSQVGFNITSITGSIYYNTPHSEHIIKPSVFFDIDLTEYLNNQNLYLEEISVDLTYYGLIDFDDSFLYSQYALLEENYNLYLQNEYLDFESYAFDGRMFRLSRDEILRLVYYDIESDKYYIRVMLEYDWNCILELNLGQNSKLDVIASLNLVKYDLNIFYTLYELTRISASEITIPYQLASIHAPNYIESGGSLHNFQNDTDIDIGTFSGFMRNSDTRQRLMLRQKLLYNFTETQSNWILLDQEYTDAILMFINPYGILESPKDFAIPITDFVFVADPDVALVEFYYHNGSQYVKKGDMIRSTVNEDNFAEFTFAWDSVISDTGVSTGEDVKIMFNITDILNNNGIYNYTLIADFDSPEPSISLGDGFQNFQNDLISNPNTSISFNSNELDSSVTEHYGWEEALAAWDSSYMSHSFNPDDYSSIWNMNSLYMLNGFPTKSAMDDWSGWNLNYNSAYTTSSFNGGTLSSQLNSGSGSKVPSQPDNFSFTSGSLSSQGDLNNTGGTYSTLQSSDASYDSTPNGVQKWDENFTSQQSYMNHSYSPDNHSSSYTMNPLDMENYFPNENYQETLNGWTLNYDSAKTLSSYSNGVLSSYLKTGTIYPYASGSINPSIGTRVQTGNLEYSDGSVTILRSVLTNTEYWNNYVVPNTDITTQWNVIGGSGTHESAIDEYSSLGTSDVITTMWTNDLRDEFRMSTRTLASSAYVYKVEVFLTATDPAAPANHPCAVPRISWNNGGSWSSYDTTKEAKTSVGSGYYDWRFDF
ncbi:MAG: hypothetical protein ACW99Q_12310, partial [Candidatus Kariarchaeaceae archaeon]